MGFVRSLIERRDASLMRWFTGPPAGQSNQPLVCKVDGQEVTLGNLYEHVRPHLSLMRQHDREVRRGRLPNYANPRDALNTPGR